MKITYNQTYELDVTIDQVPNRDLYRLQLIRIDPTAPPDVSKQEYYFEPHQLKELAAYFGEVANGVN